MQNRSESLPAPGRRRFLKTAGLALGAWTLGRLDAETVRLPFPNGERPLVAYPQKRPLLRLTARPPQLETPFSVFNEGVLTPNDAFFVRYHLAGSPPAAEVLTDEAFRLEVKGGVRSPLRLSVPEIRERFEPVEIVAVNQCSGNSRGFFEPRVPGGQMGHGAMGCARWKGARLRDVLAAADLAPGARQVVLDGLDRPPLPGVPDFIKALDLDQALDPDVLLAYEMNGEPLPWLNGYPLRLVMPGHYGTYWIKHLHEITVTDSEFSGFWMNPAYRIPDDPCAHIEPGTKPSRTLPIHRFNVRSFITSVADGGRLAVGRRHVIRGIAFDGGFGIRDVLFSGDDGQTWRAAELGRDLGRFAFREWTVDFTVTRPGRRVLMARATNRLGQSQPMEPLWNPSGYMRNVVEKVEVEVA